MVGGAHKSEVFWTGRGQELDKYSNWAPGEPNSYGDEDCAMLCTNMWEADAEGQWIDVGCGMAVPFCCELPCSRRREVSAIESEHSKNLQSDFWRYEQLFKLRADPNHPYVKFGTGNRQTLRDGDAGAREALLTFHRRYYQAEQMSLALVGPQARARRHAAKAGQLKGQVSQQV